MFFQISPVIRKKKAVLQDSTEDDNSEPEILTLAPFTPNPKIVFDVVIGSVQSRELVIKNPTGYDVNLFVKKSVPEELNLTVSWTESLIQKHSEAILEMVWCPATEGACRHVITLSDGKRINRDISITFKSVMPKQVKAFGAKKKTKPNVPPPKLQLTRKPVSPTKKLRPQRKSPIKYPSPKKKSASNYYSPPQKYRTTEQHVEYRMYKEVETVSETQQFYNYQASAWEREKIRLSDKHFHKENKENLSPDRQSYLGNLSGSFMFPTNTTFLMENKTYSEQTNAYGLALMPERRETYILQTERLEKVVQNNSTFDIENTFIQVPQSFNQRSKDNSPRFRDSLESPVRGPPLQEKNDDNQQTPTLESLLNKSRSSRKYLASPNFEYMLKGQRFSISPAGTPYTNTSPNAFSPSVHSTVSKPPSTNNSRENMGKSAAELYIQTSNQTNENNETYTKNNASSDTYVKDNSSFETYVKGNLSGDTYVKDSSLGDLTNFEVSPLSTRTHLIPSPAFLKPKSFNFSTAAEFNPRNEIDARLSINLSAIPEESYIINDSYSRVGSKRKSSSFCSQPPKRERTSVEPNKDWPKTGGAAVRVAKNTSGLNLKQFKNSFSQDKSQILSSITETSSKTVIVQNPFLYANIIDPFMTSQIYTCDEWLDQQEQNFKKWLNALLTPPEELSTKNEVDVAKVWHECTKKEVPKASTKEMVALNYHSNKKLEYLRKQAQHLFRSKEMSDILQKVCSVVESGKLSVREDKDLHLNLKLKSDITRLILGYNPLWLRIGLETIYNEIIPLTSNTDSHGLANFILERFLKDPYLIKKHKSVYAPKYSSDLKKFILKKFLSLVYFLDRAKNEMLIQHDPCLFCKNAVEKESKLVLIHFARETLAAVGDITKYLKCLGYVVTHAQTYIHEFEYAVNNLGVDLRDGVRLAKVMEIIQMRSDITKKLRVPAISRLQKVHNMQLVFKSLEESGYEIQYDISPKDIVDGYREKTLSFLWQIIYKFEAPLMVKSATTIQTWFRSLPVLLKRRQLKRNREKRELAARNIQLWYRSQKMSKTFFALAGWVRKYVEERKRLLATIKIQSFIRMIICRRRYLCQYHTILKLQSYAKGWLIRHNYKKRIDAAVCIQKNFRRYICRKKFLETRNAAIIIQRRYRANKQMKQMSLEYKCLKETTINIQRRYRAVCEMRIWRRKYITVKTAVVKIQSFYRMHLARKRFLRLRSAALVLQRRWRARQLCIQERSRYNEMKNSAVNIQRRFRANKLMLQDRQAYLKIKTATVKIQVWYRSILIMRPCRHRFILLKKSVVIIEQRYIALKLMRTYQTSYQTLRKTAIYVQNTVRANKMSKYQRTCFLVQKNAAIKIQRWYRATVEMRKCRNYYASLKLAVTTIEVRYKAKILMRNERESYQSLRKAAITVQVRYRGMLETRILRQRYLKLRNAAIVIQRRYIAKILARIQRERYQELRRATIVIQRRYRAEKSMEKCKEEFTTLKKTVIFVQRKYRANKLAKTTRAEYIRLRNAAIVIQRRYRAKILARIQRERYQELRMATIVIQRRYRAKKSMEKCKEEFTTLKKTVIFVHRKYSANKLAKTTRAEYIRIRNAVIVIQRRYKARILARIQRETYQELRRATLVIQRRYRAKKSMEKCREEFTTLKKTVIFVQRKYRANKLAKTTRAEYIRLRNAAIVIQRRYKAKIQRERYQELRRATLVIQRRYRAKKSMEKCREEFTTLKKTVIFVQRKYRANKLAKTTRAEYIRIRNAAIVIQTRYRAKVLARIQRERYQELRRATLVIQRRYRAKKSMEKCREEFTTLKKTVIFVQRKYRANKLAKTTRTEYIRLRNAAIVIQRRYKAKIQRERYQELRRATLVIQKRYRAKKSMEKCREEFTTLKKTVIFVQRKYRANKLAKTTRAEYIRLRNAAVVLQRRFRAFLTPEAIEARRVWKEQNAAAVKIQAYWRGYSLRKSNIPVMVALRKRRERKVVEPKPACQGKTLAELCEDAMLCMTAVNSSLIMIISALEDLDFITRHCRDLAIRLSHILPHQLYIIITSAARSLPEMNALNTATLILINFCKCPQTRENIWHPEYLDGLINVLLHWCDKEAPLFSSLCTLLWLMGHKEEWKKVILALPNIEQRLNKIHTLVHRKQNMVMRSKKVINDSFYGPIRNQRLPTRTANWGLDCDRPNTFKNSVFALTNLFRVLNIQT